MPQLKKAMTEVRIPFQKMTFTPDIPSSALAVNEYNEGANVETDVRGIRSVSGDEAVFNTVGRNGTYITGGFRDDDQFWFIAASQSVTETITLIQPDVPALGYVTYTFVNDAIDFSKFSIGETVTIQGCSPNVYNGTFQVDALTNTTVPPYVTIVVANPGTLLPVTSFGTITAAGLWSCRNPKTGGWSDITPNIVGGVFPNYPYNQATNITHAWNGTIPFFNDENNPPMFWPDVERLSFPVTGASGDGVTTTITFPTQDIQPWQIGDTVLVEGVEPATGVGTFQGYNAVATVTAATTSSVSYLDPFTDTYVSGTGFIEDPIPRMIMYSNEIPKNIADIVFVNATTQRITLRNALAVAPYTVGDQIVITNVNSFFNGVFNVVSSTTTTIDYLASPGAAWPGVTSGIVSPRYSWNYNPEWSSVYAKFMRLYNTPNVGSILVAGNLVATNAATGFTEIYPVTVQWSQQFGLNQAPDLWEPTINNVANQLEVPLRGEALDAFASNGQLFISSYWDTVVFSPINYSTTSAPILGVRLFTEGRGLLTSNCFASADKITYGVDARDIWMFDGQSFRGIGDQRVKNWFYDQLDQNFIERIHCQINTQRNQFEIYYPTTEAISGIPNKMLAYRFDIDSWQAPRDVDRASFSCESPIWRENSGRIPWIINKASRTVFYIRGSFDSKLIQKDQGYNFVTKNIGPGDTQVPIASSFRRDNIKLLPEYSGKLMVHRILPEVVNLNNNELPINPAASFATTAITGDGTTATVTYVAQLVAPFNIGDSITLSGVTPATWNGIHVVTSCTTTQVQFASAIVTPATVQGIVATNLIGSIGIQLEGANSVGQAPVTKSAVTLLTNTDSPWCQFSNNAYRVNTIEITNSSMYNIWHCSATSWQYTQTEDDR
tara:strand:- start:85 stop:2760 length:2676 start_codon:yes stop_codon:yes gene_type:complete